MVRFYSIPADVGRPFELALESYGVIIITRQTFQGVCLCVCVCGCIFNPDAVSLITVRPSSFARAVCVCMSRKLACPFFLPRKCLTLSNRLVPTVPKTFPELLLDCHAGRSGSHLTLPLSSQESMFESTSSRRSLYLFNSSCLGIDSHGRFQASSGYLSALYNNTLKTVA